MLNDKQNFTDNINLSDSSHNNIMYTSVVYDYLTGGIMLM